MNKLTKITVALSTVVSCAAFAQTGSDADQARRERNANEVMASHHVDNNSMSASVQRIPEDLRVATHHAADKTREETHKVAEATRNETHKVENSKPAQSTREETHKVAQSTRDFTHRHLQNLRAFSARQDAKFHAKNGSVPNRAAGEMPAS
jgi:ribosomal protein S7